MAFVYWVKAPHHTDMFTEGYIGFTGKTVEGRFKEHLKHALSTTTVKHIIHKAITKYIDLVEVVTLVEGSEQYCLEVEEKLRPDAFIGWNQNKGGAKPPSPKGRIPKPESVKKIWEKRYATLAVETAEDRQARLDSYAKWSEDSKRNHSEKRKGIKFSETHIDNMRKSQMGKKHSEETKIKMAATKASRTYDEVMPWNTSRANKDVWALSDIAYSYYSENKFVSPNIVEARMGLAKQKLAAIFRKFRAGWCPSQDVKFTDWLTEHNKTKELHESTCTT